MSLLTRAACIFGCFLGAVSFSTGQAAVSFTSHTSADGQTPGNVYAADLNNDGITDLLQDTGQGKPGFTVSLANGDGTFKAPVLYSEPFSGVIGTSPLVTADFNRDGKLDIAAVSYPGNQIAVYLGNGDGTFQAPRVSTISLPTGWHFGSGGAAAADFNADGKPDIVAWADNWDSADPSTTTTGLYVMEGDGTGGFSNPHLALTGPPAQTDFHVFVGDFDADGKADLATDPYTEDYSNGFTQTTTVHVLYGNGDFTFADTTPYSQNGPPPLWISSGDLNSDGLTDLVLLYGGYSLDQHLEFLYGTTSRTFNTYSLAMPNGGTYETGASGDSTDRYFPQLVLGDFNGDGRMDLATFAENSSFNQWYVYFLLAGTSPGQFTSQAVPLGSPQQIESNVVAGLFGSSRLKPDVALNLSQNASSPPYNTPSTIVSEVNQDSGSFGPCTYPHAGQGFNVCAAGTVSGSTAAFNAAANSFGQLRKIELWVDGKKVGEQHHAWEQHAWFSYSATFAAGTHQAAMYAADVDNRLQKYSFSFTVGGTSACSAPSTYGVHVCSPVNGSTVSSPVKATATGKISGTLSRMEIWVDGVKKYSETTSLTESDSITLASGKHRFDFYAVNTAGTKWETTVYATVP